MRILLSWSGDRSRAIAEALRAWLPGIIRGVSPWISTQDIAAAGRQPQAEKENTTQAQNTAQEQNTVKPIQPKANEQPAAQPLALPDHVANGSNFRLPKNC
jgi:hypothetical protein